MATTEKFYTGNSSTTTFGFPFPILQNSDLIVEVNGVIKTENTSGTNNDYSIVNTDVVFNTAPSGASGGNPADDIHIYRRTDVDTPKAVFAAGSAIRAGDLNNIIDQSLYSNQEQHQKIRTDDIRDGSITSLKIKDGTIVDADINASAAITLTKLGNGALPTGITVNTDNIVNGTIKDEDVSLTANIQGSKLLNDSVTLDKLGPGALPTDITVTGTNIINRSIKEEDIEVGTLDNRYYTETELDAGQLDNRYYTENELDAGQLDNRYYLESELDGGVLDPRYYTKSQLDGGQLNNLYYTESELNGGRLDDQYFQESELLGGSLDGRYYTETELDAGQLDNRYYTETELDAGQLDNRYNTKTEAEALFLRQDSSETIASGVTWSSTDSKVATTAAIDARIIDLLDDVGGFVPLANETSFPTANPDINNGAGTVVSVKAVSTNLTPSSGTVTIANGAGTGNTVTITGVTGVIPQGFGMILETTSTLHTYAFHRLQAKATEVNTVATNIGNVIACGQNLTDIENFADLYQISQTAPTTRADGSSLTIGDLWFDSSSNQVMMVYDGSAGDGFSPITPNQSTITNINTVAGHVTFLEDLGLITDAINTGSGNNSINTVGAAIANVNTTATNIADITTVANDLNESTSEIETVANSIGNVNTVGNNIANVNAVATNETNINAVKNNSTNINAVNANKTNIDAVAANNSNITAVKNNETNINTVSGINADVTTVAGISSDVTAVAGNNANITAVKNNETNINAVNSNSTNINAVNSNKTNIDAVANNATNINSAVSNATNINAAVNNASNINSAVANATNINTVSSNIGQVNSFANLYRIDSSDPSTNNDQGDLYFNTTSNELRVYNGSTWQGGVTATGNLAGLGANTFTGNQTVNANIIVSGTVDGKDISALGITGTTLANGVTATTQSASDNSTKVATTAYTDTAIANLVDSSPSALNTLNELAAAIGDDANFSTTITNSIATKAPINNPTFTGTVTAGTIDGTNLTLDFGTL